MQDSQAQGRYEILVTLGAGILSVKCKHSFWNRTYNSNTNNFNFNFCYS